MDAQQLLRDLQARRQQHHILLERQRQQQLQQAQQRQHQWTNVQALLSGVGPAPRVAEPVVQQQGVAEDDVVEVS